MRHARVTRDGTAHWVQICFCRVPLEEERPYWEEYFDFVSITDAHARRNCRDLNGTQAWACSDCDCTRRLEAKLQRTGEPLLQRLRNSDHHESLGAAKPRLSQCSQNQVAAVVPTAMLLRDQVAHETRGKTRRKSPG